MHWTCQNTALWAALTGITAAVAGVIANLSVFFSIHTLFTATQTHDWNGSSGQNSVWP